MSGKGKKHRPASASEELPLKPIQRRKDRKEGPRMSDIVNRIIETKRKDEEEKRGKEEEERKRKEEEEERVRQEEEERMQLEEEERRREEEEERRREEEERRREEEERKQREEEEAERQKELQKEQQKRRTPGSKSSRSGTLTRSDKSVSPQQKQQFSPYGNPLPAITPSPSTSEDMVDHDDISWAQQYTCSRDSSWERKASLGTNPEDSPAVVSMSSNDVPVHGDDNNNLTGSGAAITGTKQWQDGKNLAECNRHMLTNEIDCDVTFIVGDDEEAIMAHSYVLMARSATLADQLRKDSAKRSKLYTIAGVSPEMFRNMLMYLYTDEIDLKVEGALTLIPLANKFGLTVLKSKCFSVVMLEMGAHNVCSILEQAHLYGEVEVYSKCRRFILFTGDEVLKSNSIQDLCRECLHNIVRSDDLNADEVSVFNGLAYWAKVQCARQKLQASDTNRRKVLGSLVFCVRYNQMNVRDFTQHISKRSILSADEKILLYQYYHGEIHNLPRDLSHSKARNLRHRETYDDDHTPSISNEPDLIMHGSSKPNHGSPKQKHFSPTPKHGSSKPRSISSSSIEFEERGIRRVGRFEKKEGSWEVNRPDAISFMASDAFNLVGFQLYGPTTKACIYVIDIIVHDDFKNVIITESKNVTIEKGGVFNIMLAGRIRVPEGRFFTVEIKMSGKEKTGRGVHGVRRVSEDGITFQFANSRKSHNGTDVEMGQIPAILFTKA